MPAPLRCHSPPRKRGESHLRADCLGVEQHRVVAEAPQQAGLLREPLLLVRLQRDGHVPGQLQVAVDPEWLERRDRGVEVLAPEPLEQPAARRGSATTPFPTPWVSDE